MSINRRHFIGFLAGVPAYVILSGCGYPTPINPPVYEREVTLTQLIEEVRLHARDLPGGDGLRTEPVQNTHSMEPLIRGGDYLVIAGKRNRKFESLKAGEIILYQADWRPANAAPVCHRLVKKDKDGWILSGDNAERSEPQWRVTEGNYIGVVVAIYRLKKQA